jgi:hypothetical protein
VEWPEWLPTYHIYGTRRHRRRRRHRHLLIIYSIDKLIGPTARKSVQGRLLYHL